ncbi:hypothetical protein B7494_g6216 [Chlorociboria aeruginascens]|nr:hypothetical protein B7494_g6216 [Chlorociboria aeruginascens]
MEKAYGAGMCAQGSAQEAGTSADALLNTEYHNVIENYMEKQRRKELVENWERKIIEFEVKFRAQIALQHLNGDGSGSGSGHQRGLNIERENLLEAQETKRLAEQELQSIQSSIRLYNTTQQTFSPGSRTYESAAEMLVGAREKKSQIEA